MPRAKSNAKKWIGLAIIILIIAVVAVGVMGVFSPKTLDVEMVGIHVAVPEGTFETGNTDFNNYATYTGKNHEWSVYAINLNRIDLENIVYKTRVDEFNSEKDMNTLFNKQQNNNGVSFYKLGNGDNVVSYFTVNNITFKVNGDESTVISIVKGTQDLNKGSTFTFD